MKPEDFISAISKAAVENMQKTRIPASFTIAQSALESGWGEHAPGFNLFGIKADLLWKGPSVDYETFEYVHGAKISVMAKWRKYQNWLESIEDHATFLMQPRYSAAFATSNGEDFAREIAKAGYATDPLYAEKVIEIMKFHNLYIFDKPEIKMTEQPTQSGRILTNHAAVSVSMVVGTVIHTILQILKAKAGIDLSDQEPQILIAIMSVAGYVTKRPA